jgi:hypothetical protein
MKYVRIALYLAMFLFLFETGYTQTLKFCEKVDGNGNAVNAKTLFTIDKSKGGSVKFLVKLPFSVGTTKVTYEIYTVGGNGAETFKKSIVQDVSADKMWFYTDAKFTTEGSYNVKVYDGSGNHLVSGNLTIQYG